MAHICSTQALEEIRQLVDGGINERNASYAHRIASEYEGDDPDGIISKVLELVSQYTVHAMPHTAA